MIDRNSNYNTFVKSLIMHEIITYFFPVPILILLLTFNFKFANENIILFLVLCGISSAFSLLLQIWLKYLVVKPVVTLESALKNGQTSFNNAFIENAKKRALIVPVCNSFIVLFRWSIGTFIVIMIPLLIMRKIEVHEVIAFIILTGSTGLVSMPIYYFTDEVYYKRILSHPILAALKIPKPFKLSLAQKIILSLSISIIYPVSLLLFLIIFQYYGYIKFEGNQLSILLITFVSLGLSIILGFLFSNNIKMTVDNLKRSMDQFANGNLSSIKMLSLTSLDDFGDLVFKFNLLSQRLNIRMEELLKIGSGDLSFSLKLNSHNDELGKTILKMYDSLKQLIQQNLLLSRQVSTGADMIASAGQELSQGATEQAAAIEEISSSVMQINSHSKHNVENAEEANSIARQTTDSAHKGNDMMAQLIDAVKDINVSAEKIKNVVKLIDDIAFQINLLALNANVEAARAGKYGKGFSVVAEEVRTLANRSEQSVKETYQIVESAIENISKVNSLVNSTAKQLNSIVDHTGNVSGILEKISTASKDQALSLEEIAKSLNQIELVVQNTASNSEETASASEELSGQAQELNSIVNKFTL